MLVEFRHRSWFDEDRRAELLGFLEERGMSYVTVDAPRLDAANVPRTLVAATSPLAYVRFHGRNAATWNIRGGGAAQRFDYLYGAARARRVGRAAARARRRRRQRLRVLQQQQRDRRRRAGAGGRRAAAAGCCASRRPGRLSVAPVRGAGAASVAAVRVLCGRPRPARRPRALRRA